MINGLDIYYSKKVSASGLKPVSNNKQQTQKAEGLKPISKGKGCKKYMGKDLKYCNKFNIC